MPPFPRFPSRKPHATLFFFFSSSSSSSSAPLDEGLFREAPPPRAGGYTRGDATYLSLSRALAADGDLPGIHALLARMRSDPRPFFEPLFVPMLRVLPPLDALHLFDEMPDSFRCWPSSYSLNTVLASLLRSPPHAHLALPFFRAHPDIAPSLLTFNLVLNSLARARHRAALDEAVDLLRAMPRRGLRADAYTYGTLVAALCRAGRAADAMALLDEMLREGVKPTAVIFNTLLHAACQARDLARAAKLTRYMLLKGCTPTLATYNILVHGLCLKGKFESAVRLLDRLIRDGHTPNEITYGTIMDGFVKLDQLSEAIRVVEMMEEHGVRPNEFIYSALITGCFRSGDVDEAMRIWTVMVDRGVKPNTVLYTALIDGLCRNGRVKEAEEALFKMTAEECIPNVLTYSSLVRGYFKAGDCKRALTTWKEMIGRGFEPNEISYSILINGLCEVGRVKEGMMVWRSMINKGYSLDVIAYSSMIRGLSLAGQVDGGLRLFNDMLACRDVEPDVVTYNILFDGLIKEGDLTRAMGLLGQMLDSGCDPDSVTCNTFCKGLGGEERREFLVGLVVRLCQKGRAAGVAAVTAVMLEKYLPPEMNTWEMVVRVICNGRRVRKKVESCWKDIMDMP